MALDLIALPLGCIVVPFQGDSQPPVVALKTYRRRSCLQLFRDSPESHDTNPASVAELLANP